VAKPDYYPYWATVLENDPSNGSPNRSTPSAEKQNYGQRTNKNTLRQDINYLFNKIREWIQFFDEQSTVGDVYIHLAASAPSLVALGTQLGGTWDYIDSGTGADTIAGQAVIVYKRTA